MTTAQTISAQLDDDGQQWEDAAGTDIATLCDAVSDATTHEHGIGAGPRRYDFADGSGIVVTDECWDILAPDCTAYCMAGGGCECAAQADDDVITGTLCDYHTGKELRPATATETRDSIEAAAHDDGIGVIVIEGRDCYVSGGAS